MKKFFVIVIVVVPLMLSGFFIVNSVISQNFPLFRSINDESENIEQTYQAGLGYCQNNYQNFESVNEQSEYEMCIKLVEDWYNEIR